MSGQTGKYIEKQRELPVYGEFDVIVAGAGMSGCCASIAAARLGVNTLLVERSGMLGGVATSSMMSSITNYFFTSGNKQIIKGIPDEIISKLVEAGVSSPHWKNSAVPQIPHNADVIQVVMYNMMKEAGVRILLHTYISDVVTEPLPGGDRALKGIIIENKAGRQAVYGKTAVDCTGDADIADTMSEGAGVGYGIEHFSGVPSPDTGKGKVRIFNIFNPSAHERTDTVEITVWDWMGDLKRVAIEDHAGNPLPFQLIDNEYTRYWDHQYFRLIVEATVPATGYITVVMKEAELGAEYPFIFNRFPRTTPEYKPVTLENDHIKAFFSPENGALLSLIDKKTGKERIKCGSGGGGLVLWNCESRSNNAWLIGRILGRTPVTKTFRLTPLRDGDLRSGFEMEQEIMSSKITTTVSLDRNARALAYSFVIDWHEYTSRDGGKNVPVLTFSLPLADAPSAYQTDVAAGSIRRQSLYQDVSGLQYGAAVYDAEDRALAIVSDCKYGYRGCEGILSNTLINSANRPDPYPERGMHKINLWVAVDSACPKGLQEAAAEFCRPMNYLHTGSHKGTLAPAGALLDLCAETSVLSSVGLTCDGSLLVRVYETCGKADNVTVSLPFVAKAANLVDLDENVLGAAKISGTSVSFPIAANSIAAVKICK